jgi:hypothetical protein
MFHQAAIDLEWSVEQRIELDAVFAANTIHALEPLCLPVKL